jgi:PAS domain S-box-containing protein
MNSFITLTQTELEKLIADRTTDLTATITRLQSELKQCRQSVNKQKKKKLLFDYEHLINETQKIAQVGSYECDIIAGTWTSSEMLDEIFGIDKKYKRTLDGWLDLVHPDQREEMSDYFTRYVVGDKNQFNKDYRIVNFNNHNEKWVSGRGNLIFDDTGNLVKMIGTIQDITERVNTERALRKSNKELMLAKEKAEEADRLKTAFLANMSHEIRTPMNGIMGYAEMLMRPDITMNKKSEFPEIIYRSSKQLLRIINDILDISKIEADQMHLLPEKINLNQLLDHILDFYVNDTSLQKKKNTICLSKALTDEKSFIFADPSRLEQIITNLLDNALKFTTNGTIEFGYHLGDKTIELFVKDTGVGISPEKQAIIFERFRQAEESFSSPYGGNGLGLAISKGLVKLMDGNIWVQSTINKGSNFYVSIPHHQPLLPKTNKKKESRLSGN